MHSRAVLVVAHSADAKVEIRDCLSDGEWKLTVVREMDEWQHALEHAAVDVLVVDASFWHDDESRNRVTNDHPSLPVIVVTDDAADEGVLIRHLRFGAASFVPRGHARRQLSQTVRDVLMLADRNPLRERMRRYIRSGHVTFELPNDLDDVSVTASYLRLVMDGYGLGDDRTRFQLCLAFVEALTNAIVHGNLGVSSDLREGEPEAYFRQIEERRGLDPYRERRIEVELRFECEEVVIVVRDQGEGFDTSRLDTPPDPEAALLPHGRGLLIMRAYTDDLTWNDRGNEVRMSKHLPAAISDDLE